MQAKFFDSPSGALDLVKAADVVLGAWAKVKRTNMSCAGLLRAGGKWMGLTVVTDRNATQYTTVRAVNPVRRVRSSKSYRKDVGPIKLTLWDFRVVQFMPGRGVQEQCQFAC